MNNEISNLKYSVIIPLYNEEGSIDILYSALKDVFTKLEGNGEIIFVDDGSGDGSFDGLSKIAARDKGVKVISFRRNFGKSAALSAGFEEAKGETIITIDGDLQDPPSEIPKLIRKLKDYDLVAGWRRKRADSFLKWLASFLFNHIVSFVTGVKIHDVNCGYKAMKKEVANELEIYGEMHRFIPTLVHWKGFKVGEEIIEHRERRFGKSKYGFDKSIRGFLDLVTLVFLTRYKRRPAHFFGTIGLVLNLVGFVICVYIVRLKFLFGNIQGRQPLLMAGVLFIIVGVQLLSTGLIGEMVTHLFRRDTPEYTVRERINC